ncbi:NADPH:quinone oxidoreductase family protein [Paracandidimonas lactea]|uniref:NADPH:quinone oxidoreductase family protein n=1 Tax=Paracandidimonas lactea TaxID=2895524 RepID=UPI001F48C3E8|nr:NADPH:quinone oxidoreductase family protein [Paracandidimonas lactea]
MKAVVCRRYGGPDVAKLETIAAPAMLPGGVRIRVDACAASFASLLVMEGKHQNRAPLPLIPGTEIAGTVVEVDGASSRFRPGDRVIAGVQSGGYAQEVVAPETTVFHLPDDIGFDAGAQLPTIYGTAYGALKWRAQVEPGEVVLVHGAAGGSGLAAVEVAKALGAKVIAVAGSAAKQSIVREHGADHAINYHDTDWRTEVLNLTGQRGADVIYDPVGGATFDTSLRCIAPEGRIIPMGFASGTIPSIPANIALVKNISVLGVYWGYYFGWGRHAPRAGNDARLREGYAQIFDWVREGQIKPRAHAVLPLSRFRSALEMLTTRDVIGRVVMHPHE